MPDPRLDHIRALLMDARLEEALQAVYDLTREVAPGESGRVMPSVAAHKRLERERREGTVTDDDYRAQLARLTKAAIELVDEIERRQPSPAPTAAAPRKVDFGIITIREDELSAVLQRFPDKIGTVEGHRRYRLRRVPLDASESYTVAVVRCVEQGNGEAQAAAHDLLEDLSPAWILVVGIAGGVPAHELSLGDVVVSTRIHDFSVEAVLKDHAREYALAGGPLHPEAARWAADIPAMVVDGELGGWNEESALGRGFPPVAVTDDKLYGDDAWQKSVRETIERRFGGVSEWRRPRVTTGAVASSDRLIKDAEILQVWLKVARQVVAVEMESAGVYRAAHGRQVPFLSIRGISDVVGFNRHPDWTEYACHSAAAFTLAFLRARPLQR